MPRLIRRRFFRLAANLELADSEFQAIKNTIEEYKGTVEQSMEASPETIEIDATSLREFLKSSQRLNLCEREISLRTGRPLLEMIDSIIQSWASFLKSIGIATIADLNRELEANVDAVARLAIGRLSIIGEKVGIPRGIALAYLCYVELAKTDDVEKFVLFLKKFNFCADDEQRRSFATNMIGSYKALPK